MEGVAYLGMVFQERRGKVTNYRSELTLSVSLTAAATAVVHFPLNMYYFFAHFISLCKKYYFSFHLKLHIYVFVYVFVYVLLLLVCNHCASRYKHD